MWADPSHLCRSLGLSPARTRRGLWPIPPCSGLPENLNPVSPPHPHQIGDDSLTRANRPISILPTWPELPRLPTPLYLQEEARAEKYGLPPPVQSKCLIQNWAMVTNHCSRQITPLPLSHRLPPLPKLAMW